MVVILGLWVEYLSLLKKFEPFTFRLQTTMIWTIRGQTVDHVENLFVCLFVCSGSLHEQINGVEYLDKYIFDDWTVKSPRSNEQCQLRRHTKSCCIALDNCFHVIDLIKFS